MDGVVSDLAGGIRSYADQHPETREAAVLLAHRVVGGEAVAPDPAVRAVWRSLPHIFWSGLRLLPDALALVELCEQHFGPQHVTFFSRVCGPACMVGKQLWLGRYFPRYSDRGFLFGWHKHVAASPRALLIDDSEEHTTAFAAAGGRTFLISREGPTGYHNGQLVEQLRAFLQTLNGT